MAKRAFKGINWSSLTEKIPESEKNNFAVFKALSDSYARKMTANPEAPPKINWDYYRKNVAIPGLVDTFQKQYEALSIPYPEDKFSHLIEAKKQEYVQKREELIKQSDIRIKSCEEQIEKIKNMVAPEQMTMEDFVEIYPNCSPCNPERQTLWPHDPEDQIHLNPEEYKRLKKEYDESDEH